MAGQDNGFVLSQLLDQFPDLRNLPGIQSHSGLVQNDDVRVPQNGLGNAHTLPVSLGQVADQPVFHIGNLSQGHHPLQFPPDLSDALRPGHKTQIFLRRPVHVQRRKLRQIPQMLLGGHGVLKNIHAVNPDPAGGSGKAAGQNVHGCGFSRAVGAQKAIDLSFRDGKGQIIQRQMTSVSFGQMRYFNQGNASFVHSHNNSRQFC